MSADDTFDEQIDRVRKTLRKGGPGWLAQYPDGVDVSDWPAAGYVGEDGVMVSAAEAEGLGLAADFDRLNPVVRAAVLEDRRRLWCEQNPDKVQGRFGPVDPWVVEMLAAIADANEAYEAGDCE